MKKKILLTLLFSSLLLININEVKADSGFCVYQNYGRCISDPYNTDYCDINLADFAKSKFLVYQYKDDVPIGAYYYSGTRSASINGNNFNIYDSTGRQIFETYDLSNADDIAVMIQSGYFKEDTDGTAENFFGSNGCITYFTNDNVSNNNDQKDYCATGYDGDSYYYDDEKGQSIFPYCFKRYNYTSSGDYYNSPDIIDPGTKTQDGPFICYYNNNELIFTYYYYSDGTYSFSMEMPLSSLKREITENKNSIFYGYSSIESGGAGELFTDLSTGTCPASIKYNYVTNNVAICKNESDCDEASVGAGAITGTVPTYSLKQSGNNDKNYDDCDSLLDSEIVTIINKYLDILKIAVPTLIVLLGMLDFAKAAFSSNEDGMKKSQQKFIKRLMIGVAIFLIPTLVNIILLLFDGIITTGNCGVK